MALFQFQCLDCECVYEELVKHDAKNKYATVKCPACESKKKKRLLHNIAGIVFKNPKGTSREDNFDYVAKYNMDMAKKTRSLAEEKSHVGRSPYNKIKDTTPMNRII